MKCRKGILAFVVVFVVALTTIPTVVLAMPIGSTHSLTTTFVGGNNYAGNMFDVDVTSLDHVEIDGFDVNLQTKGGDALVSVYYRSGSYVGAESTSDGWILAGSQTVTPRGMGNPTPLNIGGIVLHPGQRYGFYITVTDYAATMIYTNNNNTYSDSNISVTTGIGKGTPDFSGETRTERTWNGTIYYHTGYGITASAGVGGSINPSMVVTPGGTFTYTITPDSGYSIASVLVDGVDQGAITSYTFENVQESHTIAVSFIADTPTPPTENGGESDPTYVDRNLNNNSGITVSGTDIHRSAGLSVRNLDESALPTALREAVADGRMILGYDVSLSRGFRGSIDLSFPVGSAYEGQLVTILHYVNGSVETYTAVVTNGMATITVDSLSPFLVLATGVTTPESVVLDPPKTGEAGSVKGLVMVLVALTGVMIPKRRKV